MHDSGGSVSVRSVSVRSVSVRSVSVHGSISSRGGAGKNRSRGINSIQLLNDSKRWWVVTVFWDAEQKGKTIPEKYLPAKNHGQSGDKR